MPAGNTNTQVNQDEINQQMIDLLKGLNEKMGLMVDVIEKRPRSDTPSSMYFTRGKDNIPELNLKNGGNTTRFEDMTVREKERTMRNYKESFSETKMGGQIEKRLQELNKKAFFTEGLTDTEKEDARREYEAFKSLRDEKLRAFAAEQNNIDAQKNSAELLANGYKDLNDYVSQINAQNEYVEQTQQRRDASDMIARSGFGNTGIGRVAQNALNRKQNMASLTNFGNMLGNKSTGAAANIGQALFGMGKAGNVATKALGGFGGVLGKLSKFLGGPWLAVFSFILDMAKSAAKAYNEWEKMTAEFIKYQTEMEKIAYEESKEKATLRTEIEVEQIQYMGEMALKMLETQSANLLEATDIQMKSYAKSFEIGVGAMTKGINQTAYDAAEAAIDQAASTRKYQVHSGLRQTQLELFGQKRSLESESKIASSMAGMRVAEVNADAARKTAASNLENKQLDYAAKAGGEAMNLNVFNAATNATMAARDVENNQYGGRSDVNPVNGESVKGEGYKAHGVDEIEGYSSGASGMAKAAAVGAGTGGDVSGVLEKNAAVVENYTEDMKREADKMKTNTDLQYKKELAAMNAQTAIAEKQADSQTQYQEKMIDYAASIEKNWLGVVKHVESWTEKFDEKFTDLSFDAGMLSKDLQTGFKNSQFDVIKSVAKSFGKSEEDVAKMQSGYLDNTGRNKLLGLEDTRQLAALGTYLGDDGLATQFASEMEIFNAGAAESVDLLDDALQSVNRMGLNGRKYTKDLVNNLKLAQKYNFKGGTKEVMEMAKWAQKTRFNLQSLGGIVDRIQEGGLEGVLQQSAQFQVLGGHAAMNSDPLGMLYDAWGDNFSLAKRYQDMTKGFGTLNKKTGETTFDNIAENMQIAAIAKAQGRSVEEVRGEIMERNKREVVNNQLTLGQRQNFDQEQLDYLGSVAKYNKDSGQFEVKVMGSDGQYHNKAVNQVTKEDLSNLQPEEHEARMETWMEQLVSVVTQMKGEQLWQTVDAASATYAETLKHFSTRLNEMHENYLQERANIIAEIKKKQNDIDANVKSYLDQFATNINDTTSDVATEAKNIRSMTNNIASALGGIADVVKKAKLAVAQSVQGMMDAQQNSSNRVAEKAGASVVDPNKPKPDTSKTPTKPYQVKAGDRVPVSWGQPELNHGFVDNTGRDPVLTAKGAEALNRYDSFNAALRAGFKDGIVNGDNQPMMVAAKDVTPINDGAVTLAQSSKKDVGMFLEPGGPLDTLFNGIFGEIHSVSDIFNGWLEEHNRQRDLMRDRSTVEPKVLPQEDALEKLYNEWSKPQERVVDRTNVYNDKVEQNIPSGKRDINVNINGRLTLDCGNQTIDFLSLMKADPMIVRRITEQVADQIYKNQNGGKTEGPGAGVRYSSMA